MFGGVHRRQPVLRLQPRAVHLPSYLDPRALLNRLFSTYWFVPTLVTGALVGLGFTLIAIDDVGGSESSWRQWLLYDGNADGAQSLLTAIAGSTITVVSVTYSMMVVALTVSSQHFGPRLLNNFMRDIAAQLVLGTFVGTFAYCLVVLRSVYSAEVGGEEGFVPALATTGAVGLTLVSIGALIYYVHHVATAMQVSEITAGVARDLERTVDRIYPEPLGEEPEPAKAEPPKLPAGALAVHALGSGYLQEVSDDAVLRLAKRHDALIFLQVRPGDFVVEGDAIAYVAPAPRDARDFAHRLWRTLVVGADRTSYQDAAFCVQQLVEVALRGLSPGVNEPFTALTAIDRLGQGLARLAARRLPSAVRVDDEGNARVVTRPRSLAQLLAPAFEPIVLHAGRSHAIGQRLLATLRLLATRARRGEDLAEISRVAEFVRTHAPLHAEAAATAS